MSASRSMADFRASDLRAKRSEKDAEQPSEECSESERVHEEIWLRDSSTW
jgi:hypothetical protein